MRAPNSAAGDDVAVLSDALDELVPENWEAWPGGYPREIECALVDAVLSIQARYGNTPDVGVRKWVRAWREHRAPHLADDLTAIARASDFGAVVGTRQIVAGRRKTTAIVEAADRLASEGVVHAGDLEPGNDKHRRAYVGVRGLGPVTWAYFCMLLGHSDVKPDTWLTRFAGEALSRRVGSDETRRLVRELARRRNVDTTTLDHAIWAGMRDRR